MSTPNTPSSPGPSAPAAAPTTTPALQEGGQSAGAPSPELSTPEAAPKEPEKDLSSSWAALTKKERKIFEESRKAQELQKKYGSFDELFSDPKKNVGKILEASKLSIDDIVKWKLTEGKDPTAEQKLETIEEKLARIQSEREQEREQVRQAALNKAESDFKGTIKSQVDSDPKAFPLLGRVEGALDEVYNTCVRFWDENPHLPEKDRRLSVSKACELVESTLFDHIKTLSDIDKVRELFKPAAADLAPTDSLKQALDTPAPNQRVASATTAPTLTSKTAATPSVEPKKLLSREESIRQLAAQFEAQMRKKG